MQNERFRGSSDIPLSSEGLMKVHQLAQQLAMKGGVDRIFASDLNRTRTTAGVISHYTRAPIVHVGPELHPWHLGSLEGSEVTPERIDYMHYLTQHEPDTPIEGYGPESTYPGESFNDFKNRTLPLFDRLLREHRANPGERTAVVTHGRDLKLMNAWLRAGAEPDGKIDVGEMNQDHDSPGSVLKVKYDPRIGTTGSSVDLRSPSYLGGGIYLIRHENTDWNKDSSTPNGTS